jgi:hypothetical protein
MPMVDVFACCARAKTGHATTTPLKTPRTSRLLMPTMGFLQPLK